MATATLVKIAAGLGGLYLVVVLLVALAQDWLLFPRWALTPEATTLPASAERLTVEVSKGDELVGAFLPADTAPPEGAALLLGFGGNAWDPDLLATHLHALFPERNVVTFHYRGYAPSTGRPSAEVIMEDAVRIHDEVVARLEPERVVAVGLSLGAGPAAHLASQRSLAGVILVTPFDSLVSLARDLYPWLPVRLLLRHRMDVAGALSDVSAPVAVIAAGEDRIVPARRADALRRAVNELVLDRVIEGADHNGIYDRRDYAEAMREALARIEGQSSPSARESR